MHSRTCERSHHAWPEYWPRAWPAGGGTYSIITVANPGIGICVGSGFSIEGESCRPLQLSTSLPHFCVCSRSPWAMTRSTMICHGCLLHRSSCRLALPGTSSAGAPWVFVWEWGCAVLTSQDLGLCPSVCASEVSGTPGRHLVDKPHNVCGRPQSHSPAAAYPRSWPQSR